MPGPKASDGEIARRLVEIRPWREAALEQLDVLAFRGMVPAERVAAIRAGNGPRDTARDAVACAGLFSELEPSLRGKHPFTAAELDKLAADGNALLTMLTPGGARTRPGEADPAAVLRDQFWAIVDARYERARSAATLVYGVRGLDAHVPPIVSRVLGPRAQAGAGDGPPAGGGAASTTGSGQGTAKPSGMRTDTTKAPDEAGQPGPTA